MQDFTGPRQPTKLRQNVTARLLTKWPAEQVYRFVHNCSEIELLAVSLNPKFPR